MSCRKRKAGTPRHVIAEDANKEFTFVQASLSHDRHGGTAAASDHGELTEAAAAEREQLEDTVTVPDVDGGAGRPPAVAKRPRLSPEAEGEPPSPAAVRSVFDQFLTLPITLEPPLTDQPARIIPLLTSTPHALPSATKSTFPVGRLTIGLESDTTLNAFFSVTRSNPAVKSSLVWLQTGKQLLKLETALEQVYLPATVQPSLDYSTIVEALHALAKRMRLIRLILSPWTQERAGGSLPGFEARVWATEKLVEGDNPSELPRKGAALTYTKTLVQGLYPGLGELQDESQLSTPSRAQGKVQLCYLGVGNGGSCEHVADIVWWHLSEPI